MVQFITHYTETISYLDSVRIALAGGCRWIQLRMKNASVDEIRPIALEAKRLCREAGATFVLDDHVLLCREIGADGVHLGKNDMPIDEARRLLGEKFIIGGTANTIDDIRTHVARGANYIGCGPFRFTTTKEKLSPTLGLEGYRQIMNEVRLLPLRGGWKGSVVAIGGITKEDLPALKSTGITGIALSGSILRAENPIEEMKSIIDIWKN